MPDLSPHTKSYVFVFDDTPITVAVTNQSLLDIEGVEAIVNAANTGMRGGGGIDGAIHKAAGSELLESLQKEAPSGCPTGEVVVTPGFKTGFKYIFHTPGPRWEDGKSGEKEYLISCYWNCMNEANLLKVPSIGFCSISTGIYRYPLDDAAFTAVETVLRYLRSAIEDIGVSHTTKVVFAMYTKPEYDMYLSVLDALYDQHLAMEKTASRGGFWYRLSQKFSGWLVR